MYEFKIKLISNVNIMNDFINILFNSFVDNVNTIPITNNYRRHRYEEEEDETFLLNQSIIQHIGEIREYYDYRTLNQHTPTPIQHTPTQYTPTQYTPTPIQYTPTQHIPTPTQYVSTQQHLIQPFSQLYNLRSNLPNVNDFFLNIIDEIFFTIEDGNSLNLDNLEDVKVVLTMDEFNSLDVIKSDAFTDKQCHICIDDYLPNEDLVLLKCKHFFHKECIKKWLTDNSSKCPICRKDCKETL